MQGAVDMNIVTHPMRKDCAQVASQNISHAARHKSSFALIPLAGPRV
jgi:hypothetical protein